MKILFLCHNLTGGGAERVCVDVANGLAKLGHQVGIMTDTAQPITYVPLPEVKLIAAAKYQKNPISSRLRAFKQLLSVLREERPDVVISILYMNATLAKLASMLTVHSPVIASDHNSFEKPASAPMPFRQKLDKFWRNYYLDGLTLLTEVDKELLNGRFKHTFVMPNPLYLTPLKEVPHKEKTVLAVGRMNNWHCKGFDLLLKAWGRVGRDAHDWKLRIVGHGNAESKGYLQSLAAGMANVEFLPYTPHIAEEYKKAEIFVLSSRYEGFGLVLTEAMSQGCACVACDYKGRQAEILKDGKDGLLCPVDDEEALAGKLQLLMKDGQLRKSLQENAIKDVDRFSIDNTVKRWERMLTSYYNLC